MATESPTSASPASTTPLSKAPASADTPAKKKRWTSRAVLRTVDAGNSAYCAVCDELIKFRARIRAEQVICNVYVKNRWDRVEHYHPQCYEDAGSPYGEPKG